jgi:hypothetical protein
VVSSPIPHTPAVHLTITVGFFETTGSFSEVSCASVLDDTGVAEPHVL